jgi:hypothetical protein
MSDGASSRESGTARFKRALRGLARPRSAGEMPKPDDQWGVWVNYRLDRLEARQAWMERLILGALILQVGLQVLGMLSG